MLSNVPTLTQCSTLGRSGALATTLCVVSSDRAISCTPTVLLLANRGDSANLAQPSWQCKAATNHLGMRSRIAATPNTVAPLTSSGITKAARGNIGPTGDSRIPHTDQPGEGYFKEDHRRKCVGPAASADRDPEVVTTLPSLSLLQRMRHRKTPID